MPDEINVLGGGGEEVAGLACHQADWHHLGRIAMQMLLRRLGENKAAEPEHQLFPHTLRPGHTTAPPPREPRGQRIGVIEI
ncbi:MAG: hypothetical protein SFU86_07585 [Pirellulaceae bacterium]|nr:hypothetical protein [Pirellulaceae bacterium]